MPQSSQRQVAEAFGVDPDLLPLLPLLLADLAALGGWPDKITEVLREATDLSARSAVVDLGCGKGAAAVACAREFGCRVTGVDLFEPFLQAADAAARAAGVDRLCSFEIADLRDVVRRPQHFDAAIFAAVGAGLFGDYADCVGAIRRCVRPGGHLVVGDGFLRHALAREARYPGYAYYETHRAAVRQLTAHGDELVRETLVAGAELERLNGRDFDKIRGRVRELAATRPQDRERLRGFLAAQRAEYDFIHEATTEAVWLLRRTPEGGPR